MQQTVRDNEKLAQRLSALQQEFHKFLEEGGSSVEATQVVAMRRLHESELDEKRRQYQAGMTEANQTIGGLESKCATLVAENESLFKELQHLHLSRSAVV